MSQDWAAAQTGFLTGDRQKDARNVTILLDTIAEVTGKADIEALMRSIVDKAIKITNAERGLLLLTDGATKKLAIKVARDKAGNPLPPGIRYSHSIPAKVFETGKAETLMDAAGGGDIALGQSILDLRLVSVMCVPLTTADERLGVLYVDSRASAKGFTQADLELFKTLGSACGMAIHNARLVEAYIEQQRLQHDLHVAKEIQQGMLPRKTIERPKIEIAGFNRPCDETGGDYYDYIAMPERRMGVIVGDVSGHGIGAALFMATARALLRAFTYKMADPAAVLREVNLFLDRDMPEGSFMTLFFGVLDTKSGAFRYASAGHNPVIFFRRQTGSFEELAKTGPGLGLLPEAAYEIRETAPLGPGDILLLYTDGVPEANYDIHETAPLRPGDILLLYTDGLPEAMNANKELFGVERMKTLLAGLKERPPAEIVQQFVRAITEWTKDNFDDDLTLVVVKGT